MEVIYNCTYRRKKEASYLIFRMKFALFASLVSLIISPLPRSYKSRAFLRRLSESSE